MKDISIFTFVVLVFLSLSCGQVDPLLTAAKSGQLAISSDPPGATIVLNGVATEFVTPDTLNDVSVGHHTVTVELQGYHTCTGSLSVDVLVNQVTLAEVFVLLDEDIQHIVLGEDFTSTTCDPCYSSSLILDGLAAELAGSFVVVRYHVWWPPPGNDPFYLANIEENKARNDYYKNFLAPHLFLDGADAGQDHGAWSALIAERALLETHIDLELAVTPAGTGGTVTASILSCTDYSSRDLHVRFAITEDEVDYEAPNGKEVFYQVMRDMLPDAAGEPLSLLPNAKREISREYAIEPEWNPDKLNIVVFIQDDDTREVLQAATAALP